MENALIHTLVHYGLAGLILIALIDLLRRIIGIPLPSIQGLTTNFAGRLFLTFALVALAGYGVQYAMMNFDHPNWHHDGGYHSSPAPKVTTSTQAAPTKPVNNDISGLGKISEKEWVYVHDQKNPGGPIFIFDKPTRSQSPRYLGTVKNEGTAAVPNYKFSRVDLGAAISLGKEKMPNDLEDLCILDQSADGKTVTLLANESQGRLFHITLTNNGSWKGIINKSIKLVNPFEEKKRWNYEGLACRKYMGKFEVILSHRGVRLADSTASEWKETDGSLFLFSLNAGTWLKEIDLKNTKKVNYKVASHVSCLTSKLGSKNAHERYISSLLTDKNGELWATMSYDSEPKKDGDPRKNCSVVYKIYGNVWEDKSWLREGKTPNPADIKIVKAFDDDRAEALALGQGSDSLLVGFDNDASSHSGPVAINKP